MATGGVLRPSCDEALLTGCLTNGNHWVLVEHDNGVWELYEAETGMLANPANMVDCPGGNSSTTLDTLFLATPWSTQYALNGLGTLIAWEVLAEPLPVTLQVNGVNHVMDLNEVVGVEALDGRVLRDTVVAIISGGGRARILSQRRAP